VPSWPNSARLSADARTIGPKLAIVRDVPVVNPLARELVFKIVYYGPGLGGKTTTLQHIHATSKPEHRGKMVSLATPVDRTLYFDFLPIRVPNLRGMGVRLQLFTVPGQVYYNATRKLVLTGADGVVMVLDSQRVRADANLESVHNLGENLKEHGRTLSEMPHVFQYNKRDLNDLITVPELQQRFNVCNAPAFETVATIGTGVYEALEAITRVVLEDFERRIPDQQAAPESKLELPEEGLAAALRMTDAETGGAGKSSAPAPSVQRPRAPDLVGAPPVAPGGDLIDSPPPARVATPPPPRVSTPPSPRVSTPRPPSSAPPPPTLATPPPPRVRTPPPPPASPLAAAVESSQASESLGPVAQASEPSAPLADARSAPTHPSSLPAAMPSSPPPPIAVEPPPSPVSEPPPSAPVEPGRPQAPSQPDRPPSVVDADEDDAPIALTRRSQPAPPQPAGVSFSALWPEAEVAVTRDLEEAIACGDYATSVLLADQLVARSFAAAAGILGAMTEAPRDPALVAMLLGLDGRRYLEFRGAVRDTRSGRDVDEQRALSAYAFAIDARLARQRVGA